MLKVLWPASLVLAFCSPAPSPPRPVAAPSPTPSRPVEEARSDGGTSRWPARPFPDSVAGFPFGITLDEFAELCRKAGQEALADSPPGAGCSGPAGAMPFEVPVVIAFACDGRICEYALTTRTGADNAARLVELLADRYGPPLNPEGYNPRCEADPPSIRFAWAWQRELGAQPAMLRFIFDCDAGEQPADRAATLYYDDEAGAAWRARQGREQEKNY